MRTLYPAVLCFASSAAATPNVLPRNTKRRHLRRHLTHLRRFTGAVEHHTSSNSAQVNSILVHCLSMAACDAGATEDLVGSAQARRTR